MSRPIDLIRCFHNAFRRDSSEIDALAFNIARDGGNLVPLFTRLQTFGEVLDYHARGEEAAVFVAIDNLTPLFSRTYLMDHRELDTMVNGLDALSKAPDPLTTARATAVLNSHLRIHLNKEDTFLYPTLREGLTDTEQVSILNIVSSKVPSEKFPMMIQWLFPLLSLDDQVSVTRGWQSLMPPQVFANVKPLIKKSVAENWTELTQQIPDL